MKQLTESWTWTDSLDKQSKLWNMDMRFGICNIRNFYRMHSLMTVSRDLSRYRLETELHPYNIKRDGGFCLSKSWKPITGSQKIVGT
jgi:hypothetical protein